MGDAVVPAASPAEPAGDTPTRLEIGRIARPHGIRGEVVVAPVTNRPERFEPGSVHFLGDREMVVTRSRAEKGRWVVAYEGVPDRTAAEGIRDAVLTGEPIDVLAEGEMWVHELVGSEVVDTAGTAQGRVIEVELNPAHDILVLDTGGLVPIVFVSEFRDGTVVVDGPDGLFDPELVEGNRAAVERRTPPRKGGKSRR